MKSDVPIEISTKTLVKFWLIPAVLVLIGAILYSARMGLLILGASLFLAIALNPIVSKISNVFPNRGRTLATAIAYIVVIAILGAFIVLVVPPIVDQVVVFVRSASDVIGSAIADWQSFSASADQYGMKDLLESVLVSLQQVTTSFAQNIGTTVVSSAGSLLSAIAAIILVVVLTFLMLIEGPSMLNEFWSSFGANKRASHARRISQKMAKVVSNFVNSQLLIALIDGSFTAVAIFILSFIFDVPISLTVPLGLLAAMMSLIPMFGAVIGGVVSTVMIIFNSIPAGIIFGVYFIIYQQIESNIIAPAVQSRSSQLPALVILASVTVGVYMFGLLGAIIAIPAAGCLKVVLDEFTEHNRIVAKTSKK